MTSKLPLTVSAGSPAPLGAHVDGEGVNFALFSAHAQSVELCLFAPGEPTEHTRITLPERSDGVWHGHVEGLGVGTQYGYRVHGPYAPQQGHRFNPDKLCVDPYARQLSGATRFDASSYGFVNNDPFTATAINREDSAPVTPRAVVTAPVPELDAPARSDAQAPPPWRREWSQSVIYEAHVGGMTQLHPQVPESQRGRFAGLAHPAVIEHLLKLGVTAVELLPVHAFVDDAFLLERGLRNYWGYSTLGYFAPEERYLAGDGPQAFRAMVDALHDAGLEVILDVVYNHTAEGSPHGPTLSFRGIDNASYYRLDPHDRSRYRDFTGCGNTLNMAHPRVRALLIDSLRYWALAMGVDGFRFDLATTLARESEAFESGGRLFAAIAADPVLSRLKLIAEPWDLGPDGYRLGGFPPGWAEWNDHYRDTVRRYWRGDPGVLAQFARRLHGSSDLFDHPGRGPWSSVNFVTSHDGFTALDLVSYADRHNEVNGEDNRDGHSANYSCNYGVEGPGADAEVQARRARHVRNLLATTLLSQGTPMLLAGDELGRTQRGNNNAYCQDNAINWIDWSGLATNRELVELVAKLTALRARHRVLRGGQFAHGTKIDARSGFADIEWLHPRGSAMDDADWQPSQSQCVAVLLSETCAQPDASASPLLLVFNPEAVSVPFTLPNNDAFAEHFNAWEVVLTTADAASVTAGTLTAPEHSVCVLEASPLRGTPA